ncbi:hypothetical protein GCM10011610_60320 [Nocardia rhizosphaerihabitans]|uniref:Uncharacterized protein n=1 Tax=Nocardia rhizosphaerihabitans TaxID=1691570 RepID=A0ABQ2KZA2_9NOCA|nr:hypothetical protein GCM10011610_60320 [Nocardia rhizosphaerihabitans]
MLRDGRIRRGGANIAKLGLQFENILTRGLVQYVFQICCPRCLLEERARPHHSLPYTLTGTAGEESPARARRAGGRGGAGGARQRKRAMRSFMTSLAPA